MRSCLLLACSLFVAFAPALAEEAPGADLDRLLARLARAADFYYDTALRFSCREAVRYQILEGGGHSVRRSGRLSFDYLFVKGARAVPEERRVAAAASEPLVIGEREIPVERLVSLAERMYFWIALFSEEIRSYYAIELAGEEDVGGRPAVVLRFRPLERDFGEMQPWSGRAWVDRERAQILRVEAETAPHGLSAERVGELLDGATPLPAELPDRTYYVHRVVSEFGVEKDGMRYPSRAEVDMIRHGIRETATGRRVDRGETLLRVTQRYRKYAFTEVATYETFRRFVDP